MLPPTRVAMEELAAARSVERLLASPRRLRPVAPWVVRRGDGGGSRDGEGGGDGGYALRVDLDGVGGGEPIHLAPSARQRADAEMDLPDLRAQSSTEPTE